ncbi:T9SS type A sorting domain-containing protein [Pinibacter soli]|uniref:T9SS type A sorting domain-containing protein n=1 Tax=Pinibacter soli TaxID=3044211 RepID=A0ABT6RFW3_9BACT|nr:T9SS type A sorting domain-containing protein [Pinibacter soli]MDI3321455.1 T9SS type A sorting domain-containing protein [Pinibacter soli]
MYLNFKNSLKSFLLGCVSLLFSSLVFAQGTATSANINIPTATVCSGSGASLTATTGLSSPTFKWYSDASLSTLLYTGATYKTDVLSITTTYYVTVQNATTLPNTTDPKTVTVAVNTNCGSTTPSDCAATGSLLYLDDFGGDNASATNIGPKLPSGQTTLGYIGNINSGNPGNGQYTLTKGWGSTPPSPLAAWQSKMDDHTFPNNLSKGYFMCVNASATPDKFYDHTITGICPNTSQLYFSIWAANLVKSGVTASPDDPSFRFEISDPSTSTVLTNFITGPLPRQSNNNVIWGNYGFSFPVPAGVSSVELKIYNNTSGGNGNDFALDDIAIYGCFPPITIPTIDGTSTPYCTNSSMTLTTTFVDNGSLGANLSYQWYYSPSQNETSWNTWTPIAGATSSSYTNPSPQAGYYRVVVGDAINISARNFNCVSASPASAVNVQPCSLPLTLLSFEASHSGNDNILNWTTTSEINVRSHIVEYSRDAVNFAPIATIPATGNEFSGNQKYQYIQRNVEGNAWYRLESIDIDGKYTYSNVVMVAAVQSNAQSCLTSKSIYPAPFTTTLHLNLYSCKAKNAIINIINTSGVIVKEEKILLSQGTSTYNLSNLGSLAAGVYMIKISTESESVVMKTMKQ